MTYYDMLSEIGHFLSHCRHNLYEDMIDTGLEYLD